MAKLVYFTEGYGDINFWRAFETEAKATAGNYPRQNQAMVDITTEEFNQINDGTNIPMGYANGEVSWNGTVDRSYDEANFKGQVENAITQLECAVRDFPSHPDVSTMNSMKTALKAIDYSSITFPYTKTLEQYCSDNGITFLGRECIP